MTKTSTLVHQRKRYFGENIPNKELGAYKDIYTHKKTGVVFVKNIFDGNYLFFNKNQLGKKCNVTSDYLRCHGPLTIGKLKPMGIKSGKLKDDTKIVICVSLNSVGSQLPIIGFCENDKDVSDGDVSNTVLWDLSKLNIDYISDTETVSSKMFTQKLTIKNKDKIYIYIDKENNSLSIQYNDIWCINYPSQTKLLLEDHGVKLSDFVLYVFPNGCEIELKKCPEVKIPKGYVNATCAPILDWFRTFNS